MNSNSSSGNRLPLTPQRAGGRQRVADLLEAACGLIAERGYEATTMAEIAARAGAKIGSLYRFFPNKDAIADTLLRQHIGILRAAYGALGERAAGATPDQVADMLIDLLVTLSPQVKSLPALMEIRADSSTIRAESRAEAAEGVVSALMVCAPLLTRDKAVQMAAVVIANMKTMLGMAMGDLPAPEGAPEEVRAMNRLYLASRLSPYRRSSDTA